jgi:two-component system phosphate regulon sensor histidine kinase PhoR
MPWFYIGVALSLMLGFVFNSLLLSVSTFLIALLFKHWHNLQQLDIWLNSDDNQAELPEVKGIWGRVFDRITQLQSQHRQSQQALKNSIIRIQKSTHAMREGVITLDANGTLEWWNAAARKMLGLQKNQDQGAPLINLLREPDFFRYFHQADFSRPITVNSPTDASQVLQITVTEFGKGDKLLVLRDITDKQNLKHMRSDFIGNVSHELRTPLTVIHGYLETIQVHHPELDKQLQKVHSRMLFQTQRMTNLVQDLLMLSRLETNINQPTEVENNVAQFCKQARADARAEAQQMGKELTINLHLNSEQYLSGVEGEVRSAITNLVINAVKYTPDGGQIDISWEVCDEGLCFSVSDDGIGIAEEHIQRLTERFYRVDASRTSSTGGTGLGLAIVKHIMHRHQGRLDIVSELGKGSRFTCIFPHPKKPLAASLYAATHG